MEEGRTEINGIRLRKFQEVLYNIIKEGSKKGGTNKIVIKAPTGSGKTFSLLIMLIDALDNRLPVVGMYPSRVLVYDQGKSVLNTLRTMNFEIDGESNFYHIKGEFEVKNERTERKKAEFYLAMLTSKTKDEVFTKVNQLWGKNLLILTVPEYPYLFLTKLGLSGIVSQIFEATTKYSTEEAIDKLDYIPKQAISPVSNLFARIFNGYWFIDEFHLYSGISRSSLNALIRAYDFLNKNNPITKPIIFSSATPTNMEGEKLEVKTSKEGSKIKKKTKIVFHLVTRNPQEELVNNVSQKVEKQTAIILDRVYYLSQLCQKNWEEKPALVWGLQKDYGNCVKTDKIENQKIIIGNQALSFGVDIPNLDMGYIFAHDAETLIQRFGRFGRKGEGSAEVHIFLENKYRARELSNYDQKTIDYETFLDLIRKIYDKRVDDQLDQLTFSRGREKAIFSAVEIIYAIEQGKDFVKSIIENVPKVNLKLKPSADDYFKVFSLRPGGIQGKICNSDHDDEFFTLLRNFEYDLNGQCFNLQKPVKESPYIEVSAVEVKTCELIPIDLFYKYKPRLVFRSQRQQIYLGELGELGESYVILIKKSCFEKPGEWENERRMAELVSTYESALPVYTNRGERFIALALFI
ncbi:MAG: DEAD/DEAH box helicase [Metallosphaera sp.]